MARDAWTDERLDDLKSSIDGGFRDTRTEFRTVRTEFRAVQTEFQAVRAEAGAFRTAMAEQFAAQNRMIVQLFGGMFATMVIGFLSVVATILVHG
jgi:hypothetical protein